MHYSIVQPKLGGYAHIFGYWAPGKTIAIREDVMGMCHPSMYRDIFMPINAKVCSSYGSIVLFHLHATGWKHYRHVLSIPGIAGLEMVVESTGPTLRDLVPVFREILEESRLIVHVGGAFAEPCRKSSEAPIRRTLSGRPRSAHSNRRRISRVHDRKLGVLTRADAFAPTEDALPVQPGSGEVAWFAAGSEHSFQRLSATPPEVKRLWGSLLP